MSGRAFCMHGDKGTVAAQQSAPTAQQVVNVSSVKQTSPFRYPGGKTWLVPAVLDWVGGLAQRPKSLVDPFTGGGSVPLAVLRAGLVDRLVLGERDSDVSSVWQCILSSQNAALCHRIERFPISRENVMIELLRPAASNADRAFQVLLRNRTSHGGILASGSSLLVAGERGRGVASRWYPQTLVNRLHVLSALRSMIDFFEIDAFVLVERYIRRQDVVFFIDPPYTAGAGKRAGRRLYRFNELDHARLFTIMSNAAGPFLMTYDDCPEVMQMAIDHGFQVARVPMKSTHHVRKFELLISNRPVRT